jgi:hypothetical protein
MADTVRATSVAYIPTFILSLFVILLVADRKTIPLRKGSNITKNKTTSLMNASMNLVNSKNV